MGFFINNKKLEAAVRSMHQFCPVVRSIFPQTPPDDVVEASTFYLYTHLADGIFGKRFTERLHAGLREQLKFTSPVDLDTRLYRIGRHREEFQEAAIKAEPPTTAQEAFTQHVHSTIWALVNETDMPAKDRAVVRLLFPRFEHAARRVRDHLVGIKEQSRFVMK